VQVVQVCGEAAQERTNMKLYYSPGACSLAVHIALIEAGIPFELEKVDLKQKQYAGGDYRKINPKGTVPALHVGDAGILTEAAVVLQYVADQKPDRHLCPRLGTIERYRQQEWLNYISSEIHKGFGPLWDKNLPEEMKGPIKDRLAIRFEFLANHFNRDNQFIMGAQYTVADAYLFTVLRWSKYLKVDLEKWPVLLGYIERIGSRPTTQEALKQEGISY
jgi:glutathione S-transferase